MPPVTTATVSPGTTLKLVAREDVLDPDPRVCVGAAGDAAAGAAGAVGAGGGGGAGSITSGAGGGAALTAGGASDGLPPAPASRMATTAGSSRLSIEVGT